MKRKICVALTLTFALAFFTASASAQIPDDHVHGLWRDLGCTGDYNRPGLHTYECGYYNCNYAVMLNCPGDRHVIPLPFG